MPYPTVPSRRMAWDDDGSLLFRTRQDIADSPVQLLAPWPANLNDETTTTYNPDYFPTVYYVVMFPELREIDGYFIAGFNPGDVGTSTDTTNTFDGTWIQQIADFPNYANVYGYYRTGIESLAVSNVRAIRGRIWGGGASQPWISGIHIYGELAAGQTPDRLLFIDNDTGLEFNLPIDYGDVPRGSAEERELKVRNNSGSLTAGAVQITAEALFLNSGAWYRFSEGGAFQSTLPLASSIGPGADSPVITLRRVIPDSEVFGLHAGRVQVSAGSWS